MGTTSNYSWPYPESSDYVADGATAIENLADAVDTTVGGFGEYSDYTPTFTNISFASYTYRYAVVNNLLHVWFRGVLDASVSGTISMSTPTGTKPATSDAIPLGGCRAVDDDTGLQYNGISIVRSEDVFRFLSTINGTTGSAATWDAGHPFTWASGDEISFTAVVEAG